MDSPTSSTPPTDIAPIRRRKRMAIATPATVPEAPAALQKLVRRKAVVLERHRKVLGDIGMQAVQTATLQVVAQQLADIQALLRANGVVLSTPVASGPAQHGGVPSPLAGPSCAMCGRPGVYQSRTAQVPRGAQRPWYCAGEHANWAMSEDGQASQAARLITSRPANTGAVVSAVPAGGTTSLSGAMQALLGNEG